MWSRLVQYASYFMDKKKVTIGINCFCQMDLSTFNLSLVGFSLTLHDLR